MPSQFVTIQTLPFLMPIGTQHYEKLLLQLLIIGFIVIFTSCQERQKGFEISANLSGFPENSKILVTDMSNQKLLDSTRLNDGQFVVNGYLDNSPTMVSLVVLSKDEKVISNALIFIGNEKISITANKTDFTYGIRVEGSEYNKLKVELDNEVNPLYIRRSEKLQQMFTLRNEGKWNDSLQSAYWSKNGIIKQIDNEVSKAQEQFISKKTNSHYALFILLMNKKRFTKEFIQEQLDKLNPKFKKTEYVNVLNTFLASNPLKKGEPFYNFNAENSNGETVDFASFFKSNKEFTLLEFCSPHCSWCKKALPDIKKLEKSENGILQVITYNIEKNKEDWLKTMKSNGITWTSLWNENGRYSNAYTKYRISMTPTYYLFDKQGNVLGQWNGYDEKLITSIKQLIK